MQNGSKKLGIVVLAALIACVFIAAAEERRYTATEYGFAEIVPGSRQININTADENELKQLDGIGAVNAKRIIKFRSEVRPFETIHDVKLVSGIGDKTFDKIKSDICTE